MIIIRSTSLIVLCFVRWCSFSPARASAYVPPLYLSSSGLVSPPSLDHSNHAIMTNTSSSSDHVDLKENKQVAHLQKKLRYWKQEQKKQEDAYQRYVHQYTVEHGIKPIYKRDGKIDMYQLRPVYDKETERIQAEIWSIKERIKLTVATLEEEQRVQKIKEETAQRLSEYDANIRHLKDELVKASKWVKAKDLFRSKAKELKSELAQAKKEQKRILEESDVKLQSLQTEYSSSIEGLQKLSTKRLSEKEMEIGTLAEEIRDLICQLQEKREALNSKEQIVVTLDQEIQEKEMALKALLTERTSLRAMARQSWKVFTTRVRSRFGKNVKTNNNNVEGEELFIAANGEKDLQPEGQEPSQVVASG